MLPVLSSNFPKISYVKVKEGIFVGPWIRQLLDNEDFEATVNDLEQAAWHAFKDVCKRFLGNHQKA